MTRTLCIAALGDLMFGDSHTALGSGVREFCRRYSAEWLLGDLMQEPRLGADLLIGNLECALLPRRDNTLLRAYVGDRAVLTALRRAGFDVLVTANNHFLDHGDAVARETAREIETRGMRCCGYPKENRVVLFDIRGIRVGIAAYSFVSTFDRHGCDNVNRSFWAGVDQLIETSDIRVLYLHWGAEFVGRMSLQQAVLAERLIGQGVQVVIGSHPHVVQPVRFRDGGVVAYSLGNTVFDTPWWPPSTLGLILKVHVRVDTARVDRVEVGRVAVGYRQPLGLPGKLLGAERSRSFGVQRGRLEERRFQAHAAMARSAVSRAMRCHLANAMFSRPMSAGRFLLYRHQQRQRCDGFRDLDPEYAWRCGVELDAQE